jgi:hypothetical protein
MQVNEEVCAKIGQSCSNKARTKSFFTKVATPCFWTILSTSFFFFFLELLALKMNGAQAVQDPSLLDSNFIEPSKLQLWFWPSGKFAACTHFIHIQVPFNFSQLLQTPDLIFNQYHHYIKRWPEPFHTQGEEVAEISQSCLADKINDFVDILDVLPQHTVFTRDKDYLNLVALGMSTVVLTLSTYNSAHISTLEMQIIYNNKRMDHLVYIYNLHENHF